MARRTSQQPWWTDSEIVRSESWRRHRDVVVRLLWAMTDADTNDTYMHVVEPDGSILSQRFQGSE